MFFVITRGMVSGASILKIRSRWLTKIAAFAAVTTFRLLFATCRKRFVGDMLAHGVETDFDPTVAEHFVLCVWHDALLLPTFAAPKVLRKQCCCLVSKHQDGSYLADAMAWMDYSTVRGSSKKGGAEALRSLVTETAGKHIIITPDGPQGPRRQMKLGAIFVAAHSHHRLLPGAFVAKRGIRIRGSWTDLVIPLPFTTIYLVTGKPIAVPEDVSRDDLDQYVRAAQSAMDEVNEEAERRFGSGHVPDFVPRKKSLRKAA